MENNAMIVGDLDSLLSAFDARKIISVWETNKDGKMQQLFSSVPVYKVLTAFEDSNEVMSKYKIVGITLSFTTSIMIEKEI